MRATQRFLAEIRKSHEVFGYVDIIGPEQRTSRLSTVDGTVTVDRTAQFRRTAQIIAVDPLGVLLNQGYSGALGPFGTTVRPYLGVRYDDGTTEVYPLGVFRLSATTVTETADPSQGTQIQLDMFDLSRTVSRAQFQVPYVVPAGTNVVDAIKLILARTLPDLTYDAISTTLTTTAPHVFDASTDPWQAVTELATSIGCDIYFNVDGWVVIEPPTDVDAQPQPSFTFIEGDGCTMTELQTLYSDDPGFNGVIVTGESVGDELPPVRAEAWDDEPSSPTYRRGDYGEVPMFITDQNVKTQADAQRIATSVLRGQLGFASQLTVTAWTNPTYEAGDVVQVERALSNAHGLFIVDAFTVPMRKDETQTVTVSQRRRL